MKLVKYNSSATCILSGYNKISYFVFIVFVINEEILRSGLMMLGLKLASFCFVRKNFQRILQKQGMKFKLNTKVTSKYIISQTGWFMRGCK